MEAGHACGNDEVLKEYLELRAIVLDLRSM